MPRTPSHDDIAHASRAIPEAATEAATAAVAALSPMRKLAEKESATATEAVAALLAWSAARGAIEAGVLRVAALAVRGGAPVTAVAAAMGMRRENLSRRLQSVDEAKRGGAEK